MSLFFVIVVTSFLVIVALQYSVIRVILPDRLSSMARIVLSFVATLAINTTPFLYMGTDWIFDQLPWWHRELIVFPYAILMVASAFSGTILLVVWQARGALSRLLPRFDKTKRDFLRNSTRIVAGASLGVLGYGTYHENKTPEISRITLSYSGLHSDLCGFRLVHITDIHAGPFISFETIVKIVSMTNDLKPDLILLTGDYVNHNPAYINGCLRLLDNLKAPAGVFGVYGNHDY